MKKYVILIADDSETHLSLAKEVLTADNYIILEAKNGEEVFDSANVMKPDLILLDYEMPVMDGLSVLKLLKKSSKTKEIPVIMFTAKINIKEAFDAGAIDFIRKPFSKIELITRVDSVIHLIESINKIKNHEQEIEIHLESISEKNIEIHKINNELTIQSENLKEVNSLLNERQEEVISQNEEIRKKSEELRILNASKNKFFSIIGHDLRNPFQIITGFSKMLKMNYPNLDDKKKIEYINIIEQASRNVSSLLDNLLNWSSSQSNKIKINPKIIQLKKILDETIELLEINSKEKDIKIESKIKDGLKVYCDQNMISTVFRNLLNNAIKFTEEKGKITISSRIKNNMQEISIIDNGVGMSAKALKSIFQIDNQYSSKGTLGEMGNGLGLIVCKEFVEKNGGTISVESDVGVGSKFIITLPIKK